MRPYLQPFPEAEATRSALTAAVPVLETERLRLRAPKLSDWDVLEPIWRGERGVHIGGPFHEKDAWLDFNQAVAGWLLRGFGYWTVALREDDTPLGLVGLGLETEDPELEFGWLMTEAGEGCGYAFEACQAVRAHAFGTLGLKTLVSFVDRRNARSVSLARRLGAVEDDSVLPEALAAQDFAFRHSPEALP